MSEQNKNIFVRLEDNLDLMKAEFVFPQNEDFTYRELFLPFIQTQIAIIFIKGTINTLKVEEEIIRPLLHAIENELYTEVNPIQAIKKQIYCNELEVYKQTNECINALSSGFCLIFVEGSPEALAYNTGQFEHRSIEKPQSEIVLRGPNEGFIESVEVNKNLIRKHVKSNKLVSVSFEIGLTSKTTIIMLYIDGIANDKLVAEVKTRMKNIVTDSVMNISVLEQYIEDRQYSLVPSVLHTERPDRAASFLLEGHVVVMGNSPACLVAPATFWSLLHTADDTNQRWFYGNFTRFIRVIALLISMLVPSFYIAATNFHEEMIPTDLLLAIAGKRETVPFPAVIEVLIMEFTFEILREAGLRVPTPMGATIGIVGALILGQAAVEANLISPIMVIIVALTGLASFSIGDISFNFMVRIVRFLFLICTSLLGLLGLMSVLVSIIAYLVSIKSFGVPFLAPLAPLMESSKDLLFRPPVPKQSRRPAHLKPMDRIRRKEKDN